MRYYVIAGEASGDLHGANLLKEIYLRDKEAKIRCWGGDKMKATGAEVVKHINDLAFMGFAEVIKHLPTILNNISFCKRDILNYKPDAVILIDYPGFNFRLLKFLKAHGIKIFYYISPQLWAWKKGRVKLVQKYVDHMFVIFPFEKQFYEQYGVDVTYVGHPLLDELKNTDSISLSSGKKKVALIPGSRRQEISYLLPEYVKMTDQFPDVEFTVTGMSAIGEDFYRRIIGNRNIALSMDNTYGVLRTSDAAVVTSGTATLETALHNVPEVVCYKGNWLSYFIAHLVIDKSIGYICIVNLICGKKVVEELIQADVNPERLAKELRILLSEEGSVNIKQGYTALRQLLGNSGASSRAAEEMISRMH